MLIVSLFAISLPNGASAQSLAVKNNLIYDATATPNISLELRTGKRWTTELTLGFKPFPQFNPFDYSQDVDSRQKHLLIAPEVRYWLCSPFVGLFVSANTFWAHYNIGGYKIPILFKQDERRRYQGDALAAGISAGYSYILANRWSIEGELGIDAGWTWYDLYECAHCGIMFSSESQLFATPKAGISIIYYIK